jgi:SAM-dependent methyltransferase
MAGRALIDGVGVDLSPWVLLRARDRASDAELSGTLEWWLGDGRSIPRSPRWDITTCLGGSWIWHGFEGTARALAARLLPGGRMAVGDLRLRNPHDRKHLQQTGAPEAAMATGDEQREILNRLGLEVITEIAAPDEAWEEYHRTVIASAETFAAKHPNGDYRSLAASWMEDFQRDRRTLAWAVWVARKTWRPAASYQR